MASLTLCEKLGKPLYELRPDLCPYGRLTQVEMGLWGRYFELRESVKEGMSK